MTLSLRIVFVLVFTCTVLVFSNTNIVRAQSSVVPTAAVPDSATIWHITTFDENEFYGTVVERSEESILIRTKTLGEVSIPISQIKQMKVLDKERIVDGEVWPENGQASRYFLNSNGFGVRRGGGYFHNVWLLFNQMTIGVTDYASIGLGMVPFIPGDRIPLWITPKLSIPLAGKDGPVHMGIGVLLGGLLRFKDRGFGSYFGSITIGSRDRNVSAGFGKGFTYDDISEETLWSFGAMIRVERTFYFMGEGLFWDLDSSPTGGVLIGGRSVGKTLNVDFGGVIPVVDGQGATLLPWVSLSIPF